MKVIRPFQRLKTDFYRFFSKILADFFNKKEVEFKIFNYNSLFRKMIQRKIIL